MQREDDANIRRKAHKKTSGKYGGLEYSMHIAEDSPMITLVQKRFCLLAGGF